LAVLSLAVAALMGTLVFGSSLSHLVDDGARYGYNYGYVAGAPTGGPLDPSTLGATRSSAGIAGAMALSQSSAPVAGHDVDLVGVEPLRGGLLPVVLSGRFPTSPDEVAMGAVTAASLHLGVGDDATFEGPDGGPITYHLVGVIVMPSVSFGAGGGRGAAMLTAGVQRVSPETQPQQLALELEPGVAPDTLSLGTDVTPSTGQSRPADVINVARSRSVPTIVAVVVGLLAIVVLIQSLVGSVRARRRDIAVLRALGADRQWIARVVHIQASVVGFVALAIGIPIGVLAGRAVYRSFAEQLGLVATPSTPVVVIAALAIVVLVMANLAAAVPARRARRVPPSILLREP
jgi:hypothetical protein